MSENIHENIVVFWLKLHLVHCPKLAKTDEMPVSDHKRQGNGLSEEECMAKTWTT